jgi:methylenetetrahydrofolate reductase (NADPH)
MDMVSTPGGKGIVGRAVEPERIRKLVEGYSIELMPRERIEAGRVAELIGVGRTVYVTSLPGLPFEGNLRTAVELARAGLRPVPHLAARRVPSAAALADYLARAIAEAGVKEVLLIAGDLDRPLGPYADSLQLLESGLISRYGVHRVAFAGYPEGHPRIGPAALRDALRRKLRLAAEARTEQRVVAQFCFDPRKIVAWRREMEGHRGVEIRVGLAGPASMKTLLKFAARCGVGASLRMLRAQASNVIELFTTATPALPILALAAEPPSSLDSRTGLHFFPFGGFERTARWLEAIRRGDFEIRDDGRGIEVRE